MKTMTCAQMGGTCEASISADSEVAMTSAGMSHLESAHPELASQVKAMSPEEQNAWGTEFHTKWEAQAEDVAPEAVGEVAEMTVPEIPEAMPETAPAVGEGETPTV